MSASATISKLLLALLAATLVAAGDEADDFAREAFGTDAPRSTLSVTGDVYRLCCQTVAPIPREVIYYHSLSNGTVWVLMAQGKHGVITGAFVVQDAQIRASRILEDRERRGRGIRGKRYLRQFEGVGLRAGNQLDRRVHGITGATVSSRAVEKMALLALRLDALTKGTHAQRIKERQADE